jgi:hypothetical protein
MPSARHRGTRLNTSHSPPAAQPAAGDEMRTLLATAGVILMAGMLSARAQGKVKDARQVTVYFNDNANVPFLVRVQALGVASNIFASIGVTLHWRHVPPHPEPGAVVIEFVTNTPSTFMPGGLGYALPYEGVHIRIFWDRIERECCPRAILAHAIAHEITHILQGVARHSAEGIMKARWTNHEQLAMELTPLRFTPEDVKMIHRGMDARAAHAPMVAAATMTTAVELTAQ